jgi:hypothetical protein
MSGFQKVATGEGEKKGYMTFAYTNGSDPEKKARKLEVKGNTSF